MAVRHSPGSNSPPTAPHRKPPAREDESADPVGNGRTEPDGSPVPPSAAAPRPPGAHHVRQPAMRRARP
jgi:hypothetical protein